MLHLTLCSPSAVIVPFCRMLTFLIGIIFGILLSRTTATAIRKIPVRLLFFTICQLRLYRHLKVAPRITEADRFVLARACRGLPRSVVQRFLYVVKPETLAGWHRRVGKFIHYLRSQFGIWMNRLKRKKRSGRPWKYPEILRALKEQASANPGWGKWKHLFELQKRGWFLGPSTVSRYLRRIIEYRPRLNGMRALWRKFLYTHRASIAAMDFFTFRLLSFRTVHVFFIIEHDRRKLVHWNLTFHPTEDWVCQQIRDAFPFETHIRYLIFDRDAKFSCRVRRLIRDMGIKEKRITVRSPWQNGVAERFVLTIKKELFYRMNIVRTVTARRMLREYTLYYNHHRPHRSLHGDSPSGLNFPARPVPDHMIVRTTFCAGRLHSYHAAFRQAA